MKTHRSDHRPPAFRRTHLAAACGLLLAGVAHAQEAAPAPAAAASSANAAPATQTVIVTGIRKSLDSSMSLKRDAHGVVDGIVAEDIGKFPDSNLAEAMQRISGVSIDRSMGEGSKITVRGVGPEFNQVLLNGRQMPASTVQDTGASNSRAFDFANLASESIAAMEVYKTSRAESPTGGIGATINIKTARPLDNPGRVASVGLKLLSDNSNSRLPDSVKGKSMTPELSGIYSDTFADRTIGVALTGSYQVRDSGVNTVSVGNGWRSFSGADANSWGHIPTSTQDGYGNIVNRPGDTAVYQVPQNINYAVNGIHRERTNGQLTLQYAPSKQLTATLDYTYSDYRVHTKHNDISAWFNFGPSSSSWTSGSVSGPVYYSETINPPTSDIAMGGARYGVRTQLNSVGGNLLWKPSDKLSFELDAHSSSSESGADSPYGTNAVLGTASFNRGTTSVDFSHDFPVLMIDGSKIDASQQQVTGSSFRNSYMKAEVNQVQTHGKYKFDDGGKLDFGLSLTDVKNRTAYANVQRDTWGGATKAADYADSDWHADSLSKYFSRMSGSNDPRLFNQWFTWDFEKVRQEAATATGHDEWYKASNNFTTDRRTKESSQSLFAQYSKDWELVVPMGATVGVRYEKTTVDSEALVPTANGVSWGSQNELTVLFGAPSFTKLKGSYSYVLPSIDLDADLRDDVKLRMSYGESIGRPGWGDIQGGQTLDTGARVSGGTGSQGNPGLKPLLSHNSDVSLEYYYAKHSYAAVGFFRKNIDNWVGTTQQTVSPFPIHTPAGGVLWNEALSQGGCITSDTTCIRNYILRKYDGTKGVTRGPDDSLGNATGTILGQDSDPVMPFLVTMPANQQSASLHGFEFNVQHRFGDSGFGLGANYTLVMSGLKYDNHSLNNQFALEGLSNSANLVGFFENDTWNARVAYNWRDQFLASRFDGAGANPVYTEPYAQVDMTLGYKFDKNLSFSLDALNLNDGVIRQHSRTTNALESITQTGRRFLVGARYTF